MKLDVEATLRRVEAELARRGHRTVALTGSGEQWAGAVAPLASKAEYVLGDLLAYSDRKFIETAYQAILRRPVDEHGMQDFLGKLRSGALSKVEILAALRWSPEGKARGVHVDGLLAPYLLRKWRRKPVIGPVLGWLHALVRLPVLSERAALHDAVQSREVQELGRHLNSFVSSLDVRLANLSTDLASVQASHMQLLHARLDDSLQEIQRLQSALHQMHERQAELDSHVEVVARGSAERIDDVQAALGTAQLAQQQMQASLESAVRDQQEQLQSGLNSAVHAIEARLESLNDRLQVAVTQHGERLGGQDEALARHEHHIVAHGAALAGIEQQRATEAAAEGRLDPLYVAFEERFRGSQELIRERVTPYLEVLREAQVGTLATPVLDIGCGRGDWLDVMREDGFQARGVDTNALFVQLCRGKGLDVVHADALQHLRGLPDASLGGVSGLHIAEHLPFETLIALLDEIRRVLCIGGVLVLETPNPENLQVAALNFYMDPTHRNPLPPEALRWLVEARGFERVRIERLTLAREMAVPAPVDETSAGLQAINFVLDQMRAAPDYAIVARRL